ncbi:hypothetical protein ES708_12590 [subsurface metagenome]
MRRKFQCKLLFLLLVFGLALVNFSVPIKPVAAEDNIYVDQYQLQQDATRFYVVNLTSDANWIVNCTAYYKGVFHLYIFDERPTDNHVLRDGSLDASITDQAVAYNETPSLIFSSNLNDTVNSVTLNYTAPSYKLYYLEIIIVEKGPDTFRLESNFELQAYYIPFISGESRILVICSVFTTFLILFKIMKRRK